MTQSHLIVTDEGIKIYKDDPSSAILCEDQERAKEIIEESLFQGDPSLVNIEIGSIYPVPKRKKVRRIFGVILIPAMSNGQISN